MVDLVITGNQVLKGTDAQIESGIAGEAIAAAGKAVYKKAADGKIYLADANLSDEAAGCIGVTLHPADTGQPVQYQRGKKITLGAGAAPAAGTLYVLSATAGGIAPAADLASGMRATYLGAGDGAGGLDLHIHASGVTKP